ncbi:MAG: hypothetical protein AB7L28_09645 [Kofleriaceae bacterium]
MLITSALLAGGAVLVSLQLLSTRSTGLVQSGTSALYCAEAGLSLARAAVAANYTNWNAALAAGTEPAWLSSSALSHDIDGDGVSDFTLRLVDNDDELPPASNNTAQDNDMRVFVVSTCMKYPETPKAVSELIHFGGGGNCYQAQQGGCGGNNNSN